LIGVLPSTTGGEGQGQIEINPEMEARNGAPTKRKVSKRQVSKCSVSKSPVSKRQVYKTSGLQKVRFTKGQVSKRP
jgi:hypothetical protein